MGDRYREEIGRLRGALNDVSRREEAAEIVRGLIDAIVLRPSGAGRGRTLSVDLAGHLAGILNLARETKKGAACALVSDQQIKLVAGACITRYRIDWAPPLEKITFRLAP
jgi:hypothetical protein